LAIKGNRTLLAAYAKEGDGMAIFLQARPVPGIGPHMEGIAPEMAVGAAAQADGGVDTTTDQGTAVAPQALYLGIAAIVIVAGGFVGTWIYDHLAKTVSFAPPQGVGIFALFYIVAQVIERVQEPFVPYMGRAKDPETGKGKNQLTAKAELEKAVVEAFASPSSPEAAHADPNSPERTVADKKRTTDQIRANLTILLFGTSALLAMIMSGYLKARLLQTVGVTGFSHGWTLR